MYDVSHRYVGNKKKFTPSYLGPFEILEIFNAGKNLKVRDVTHNTTFTALTEYSKPYEDSTPVEIVQKELSKTENENNDDPTS